jgi:Sap, sulfolipid-1-addressing protein
VGDIFVLALTAALNPTLVAASTVMMLLPNPVRLMLGYLFGALLTSVTLGLLIISALDGSDAVATTRHTVSPAATLALGCIALMGAVVVGTDRHVGKKGDRPTREDKPKQKGPPRWQRALGRGSARVTFVVGAMLTLPGASYLAGLSRIDKANYSTPETVVAVVVFNLIMLALLEVPLVCFLFAPEWTPRAIDRAKAWIGRHSRRFAVSLLTVVGALLMLKGVLELL